MMDIPLPRLLVVDSNSNASPKPLVYERDLNPINVSVDIKITPLSTVSMEVPIEDAVPVRSWVEFFTPMGSAGIFRLRSPEYGYGESSSTLEFEHGITEVADYLVKTKYEEENIAANDAVEAVFEHYHGGRWQLGNMDVITPSSDDDPQRHIDVSVTYSTVLNAINTILEQMPKVYMTFDFTTTPWTINFALRDDNVTAEGRLERNVESATVTYDDSELCTLLYMQGLPKPDGDTDDNHYGYIPTEDQWPTTAQTKYGIVEKSISGSTSYTESEAMKMATLYLEKHEKPKISVSINAEDLSLITGEAWDTFTIGKKMRLVIDGDPVEENITELQWDDVYFKPEEITVSLAEEEDTVISYITESSSSSGGGGGGSSNPSGNTEKNKYVVQISGMSEITVYADGVQAAINAVCGTSFTGNVAVNSRQYHVTNGVIDTYPTDEGA